MSRRGHRAAHVADTVRYDRAQVTSPRVRVAADGDRAVLENQYDLRRYECLRYADPRVGPTCRRAPQAGDLAVVVGLGLYNSPCTGQDFGNVSLSDGCLYTCGALAPE